MSTSTGLSYLGDKIKEFSTHVSDIVSQKHYKNNNDTTITFDSSKNPYNNSPTNNTIETTKRPSTYPVHVGQKIYRSGAGNDTNASKTPEPSCKPPVYPFESTRYVDDKYKPLRPSHVGLSNTPVSPVGRRYSVDQHRFGASPTGLASRRHSSSLSKADRTFNRSRSTLRAFNVGSKENVSQLIDNLDFNFQKRRYNHETPILSRSPGSFDGPKNSFVPRRHSSSSPALVDRYLEQPRPPRWNSYFTPEKVAQISGGRNNQYGDYAGPVDSALYPRVSSKDFQGDRVLRQSKYSEVSMESSNIAKKFHESYKLLEQRMDSLLKGGNMSQNADSAGSPPLSRKDTKNIQKHGSPVDTTSPHTSVRGSTASSSAMAGYPFTSNRYSMSSQMSGASYKSGFENFLNATGTRRNSYLDSSLNRETDQNPYETMFYDSYAKAKMSLQKMDKIISNTSVSSGRNTSVSSGRNTSVSSGQSAYQWNRPKFLERERPYINRGQSTYSNRQSTTPFEGLGLTSKYRYKHHASPSKNYNNATQADNRNNANQPQHWNSADLVHTRKTSPTGKYPDIARRDSPPGGTVSILSAPGSSMRYCHPQWLSDIERGEKEGDQIAKGNVDKEEVVKTRPRSRSRKNIAVARPPSQRSEPRCKSACSQVQARARPDKCSKVPGKCESRQGQQGKKSQVKYEAYVPNTTAPNDPRIRTNDRYMEFLSADTINRLYFGEDNVCTNSAQANPKKPGHAHSSPMLQAWGGESHPGPVESRRLPNPSVHPTGTKSDVRCAQLGEMFTPLTDDQAFQHEEMGRANSTTATPAAKTKCKKRGLARKCSQPARNIPYLKLYS